MYEDVRRAIPPGVTLVAVVKGRSVEDTRALYEQGQRDFAENRAASLSEKSAALPPDARWHFIGNIQSRDLKTLRQLRPLVHSFDRADLVAKWPQEVPVLVQVDFTGLDRRNGVPPAGVDALLAALAERKILCRGLSTLPPKDADPRAVFRALRKLRDERGLAELSMGMSADFEVAIEEGATMVRVGTAIFG